MSERPAQPEDLFGLVGTTLAERFRVDMQIAEGGFGIVYRASQLALDRPVAIKVLKTPPGLDHGAREEFRDKFAGEAKTIARLKDPHIVDVYDFGIVRTPGGELAPWMALEWIDGETLETDLARRRGRRGRSVEDAVALLRPVVAAVAHAHKLGIAHRDIKPANIMVSHGDHGPMLRILDFGIAKIMRTDEGTGTGRTRTNGLPAFSPAYASPEQVSFSRTGPWTDVHALGLVLTEVLTDEAPFDATDMHVFEQVMAASRPTPRNKGKEVGAVEAVIARAVALSPGERWKDAGELLRELEAATGRSSNPSPAGPRRGVDAVGDTQPHPAISASARGGGEAANAGAVKVVGATTVPAPGEEAPAPRASRARTGAIVAAVIIAGGVVAVKLLGGSARAPLPVPPAPVVASPVPAPAALAAPPAPFAPAPVVEAPAPVAKPKVAKEPHRAAHARAERAAADAPPVAPPAAPTPAPEKKKTGVLDRFEKLVDRPTVEGSSK